MVNGENGGEKSHVESKNKDRADEYIDDRISRDKKTSR